MFSGRVGAGPDQDLASGLGHSVASGSGVAPGSGETPSGGNAHGYVPRALHNQNPALPGSDIEITVELIIVPV